MIFSLTKARISILPSIFRDELGFFHQPCGCKRHGQHSRGRMKQPPSVENVSDSFSTVTHSKEQTGSTPINC